MQLQETVALKKCTYIPIDTDLLKNCKNFEIGNGSWIIIFQTHAKKSCRLV
jgi:hypothetical protein